MNTILDTTLPLSCPEIINVEELAALNYVEFREWLPLNRRGAEGNLLTRLEYCYLRLSSMVDVKEEINRKYGELTALWDRTKPTDVILKYIPVIPLAAYFATNIDFSCHEIFFGMRRPVEVPEKLKSFLRDIQKLPQNKRKAIGEFLKRANVDCDNPFYFMKHRAYEAAFDKNIPEGNVAQLGADRVYQSQIMSQILSDQLSWMYDKKDFPNLQIGTGKFLTVLLFCMKLKQSADFFLLQDYSKYAVIDGEPLTDVQRKWLSRYLCASPPAQDLAICQVATALLDTKTN